MESKGEFREFNTGLMGCFSDCGICCYGYCCTPCLYGENHEKLTGEGCCSACFLYYLLYTYVCCVAVACIAAPSRLRLRQKYGIKEEPCSDCCVHMWCSACAVCQEAREIKYGAPHAQ